MSLLRPPWSVVLVLVVLAAALASGIAWKARGDREDARRLAELRALQAQMDEQRARADRIAADLEVARRDVRTVTVEVVKLIPSVTTVYVEKPGDAPRPIPDPVFTRGFVGLWNLALAGRLSDPASKPAGLPGAADAIVRARVGTADILANHAENAGKHAECRAQLTALIDWARSVQPAPDK